MMIKPVMRVLPFGAEEKPAAEAMELSGQLRLPTLDERVHLYLRAYHGRDDFTNEEYSIARNLILEAMAADISTRSRRRLPEEPFFVGLPEGATPDQPAVDARIAPPRVLAQERDEYRAPIESPMYCLPPSAEHFISKERVEHPRASIVAAMAAISRRPPITPPTRKLTTRRIAIGVAVAAVAIILLLTIVPTALLVIDPNSRGPHVALQSPPKPPDAEGMLSGRTQVGTPAAPFGIGAMPAESLARGVTNTNRNNSERADQSNSEEIAVLLRRGRALVAAGYISDARLALKRAAEAGNASAALELGATYDPIILDKLRGRNPSVMAGLEAPSAPDSKITPDLAMARAWYQIARNLGSAEASKRLETLAGRDR